MSDRRRRARPSSTRPGAGRRSPAAGRRPPPERDDRAARRDARPGRLDAHDHRPARRHRGADRADRRDGRRSSREIAGQLDDWPHGTLYEGFAEAANAGADPHAMFEHSPFIGRANPLAPPMLPARGRRRASRVEVRFGSAYEGPPGCVHGGYIAGAFDELLGATQSLSGNPGMTARLTVNYRTPDAAARRPADARRAHRGRGSQDLHQRLALRHRARRHRAAVRRGRGPVHLDGLRPVRRPEDPARAGRARPPRAAPDDASEVPVRLPTFADRLGSTVGSAVGFEARGGLDEVLLGGGVLLQARDTSACSTRPPTSGARTLRSPSSRRVLPPRPSSRERRRCPCR